MSQIRQNESFITPCFDNLCPILNCIHTPLFYPIKLPRCREKLLCGIPYPACSVGTPGFWVMIQTRPQATYDFLLRELSDTFTKQVTVNTYNKANKCRQHIRAYSVFILSKRGAARQHMFLLDEQRLGKTLKSLI